jgi:hypothetical protein
LYGRIIIVLICNLLFIGSVLIMNADREKNAQVTLLKAVRMERDEGSADGERRRCREISPGE